VETWILLGLCRFDQAGVQAWTQSGIHPVGFTLGAQLHAACSRLDFMRGTQVGVQAWPQCEIHPIGSRLGARLLTAGFRLEFVSAPTVHFICLEVNNIRELEPGPMLLRILSQVSVEPGQSRLLTAGGWLGALG
jgi:hypothetical protein